MQFNYTEYNGKLFVSTQAITENDYKKLNKEEVKKASIDSYGSGTAIGKFMYNLGFAVKVTGQGKTYYVKKKSYEEWLGRVGTLKQANDLTVENMKNIAIDKEKSKHSVPKKSLRFVREDVENIFKNKVITDLDKIEKSDIEKYQSFIINFKNEIKTKKSTDISYAATDEIAKPELGYPIKILIDDPDSTPKEKLIDLGKYENQQTKLESSLKNKGFTEKDCKFILRTAIVLSGGATILKMIQELPPKESLKLDPNPSKLYDDYKEVAKCITTQTWPLKS